jgi:hypothetical protein
MILNVTMYITGGSDRRQNCRMWPGRSFRKGFGDRGQKFQPRRWVAARGEDQQYRFLYGVRLFLRARPPLRLSLIVHTVAGALDASRPLSWLQVAAPPISFSGRDDPAPRIGTLSCSGWLHRAHVSRLLGSEGPGAGWGPFSAQGRTGSSCPADVP